MKTQTHTIIVAAILVCLSQFALAENLSTYQADAIVDGDYRRAEAELLQVLTSSPNDPFALLNLAVIYHKNGESEKARRVYDQILELKQNPLAELARGKPQRVKAIAQKGLDILDTP